ncbi:hypothetical protein QAD02_021075 [Eretmocerus hayati]|uniref:Uncharacterized protein n=1 Tax=Eretmocerus hayati TaxID=131215 RepID=A0ACC2PPE7_9HYME|nr:hypothetical protein QAD02_021075 [Eretmocerus hayati]
MVRSEKRTDDPPDPDRPNLGQPMNKISRNPRFVAIARLVFSTVNPEEAISWDPVVDERAPGDGPLMPDALRLLQHRETEKGEENEEEEYSDGGEADALRPSVAASTTVVTQSSTPTTTSSTQSTTMTLTRVCS